jgi:MFS family permease
MQYKWTVLMNTTMGVVLASADINILIIALPAIFRGINVDPMAPGAFEYLLWIIFGYDVVTATLLVTFGRLSDILGRVRMYNLGFAVYTVGSIMLYLVPDMGLRGASEILIFRLVQGVGGALIFSNSAAIIVDAFPTSERGKALGANQAAILVGSLLGLVLGGVLAVYDWRFVFLISVPFGLFGTGWSYWKLRELAVIKKGQKLDVWGNVTFALGLTIFLVGMTYSLIPFGSSAMGWGNPLVIGCLALGLGLLIAFPIIEARTKDPMFSMDLFKNRGFSSGNLAAFVAALSRGGVMLMLVILLQAIWLPLHGFSYQDTPFWAGIYIIPMSLGFVSAGPVSGWLSDKKGSRGLATGGMCLLCVIFLILSTLSYDFQYPEFAISIFLMGIGFGMFSSPNVSSIMGTVPPERRSTATGMLLTLQNTGSTVGLTLLFTEVIGALTGSLPNALASAMTNAGAPHIATSLSQIPPTLALFAAFLGYNPMVTMISELPRAVSGQISPQTLSTITSTTWFPRTIAPPFMDAIHLAFYFNAGLAVVAAIASLMRGKKEQYEYQPTKREITVPIPSERITRPKLPHPRNSRAARGSNQLRKARNHSTPRTKKLLQREAHRKAN